MTNKLLAAALWYARRGWPVFPLSPRGKEPIEKGGFHNATTDEDTIHQWWTRHPEANIGIPTSFFVCLDVDPRNGGDETLADLTTKHGQLPHTVEAITGGGGSHFLFQHPTSNRIRTTKIGLGVDVKGDGGYIVVTPSIHPEGPKYQWEASSRPDEVDIAPIPIWILENLQKPRASTQPAPLSPSSAEAQPGYRNGMSAGDTIPWGQRNNTLTSLAGSMRRRGMTQDAILAALLAENAARCDPPLPEAEVHKITASVARYAPEKTQFNQTDLGNAERLVSHQGQNLHYCYAFGSWLTWDGSRWTPDNKGEPIRLAKEVVRSIYAEASQEDDDRERKALADHATRSEASARIQSMIYLAKSEPGIPILPSDLDTNPMLLNCANGTVDLHTGELREHRREHLITKITPIPYIRDADCPIWLSLLDRVFDGNKSLMSFVQRAVGYSLTADDSEQIFFILHGAGANGKTTLLTAIMDVLGEYALNTPTETLMLKQRGAIPNDVARLRGARLISANEAEEGQRLAESLLKQLTGGDIVTARFLHGEFFDFKMSGKIWLRTNHKPTIRGTDHAIWRRVRLIPFTVTIPDEEQDKHLPEKLLTELPGILSWAIQGCLDWQQTGLGMPDEIKQATAKYRGEMDILGTFLEECCILSQATETRAGDLYKTYTTWCGESGERAVSQTVFGRRMTERGFDKYKDRTGWQYVGIGVVRV